ncbi:hypothetical protein DFH09DRAFT_1171480 [Mycena vulgaris]|nr:hypothetical protein DFH09DRAFT_1171480 [Mycena vulgaris]
MERWERWWEVCRRAGVRLEDCTGGLLGELPQDEPESESESDEAEDEEEEGEGEWSIAVPPMASEGGNHIDELRQLLEECRAMDEGRDENYMFNSAGAMALFPDMPPVASGSGL